MFPIKEFSVLKKNLKKDYSGFKKIKVALLGDTATQFLSTALRATGYEQLMDLEIWEADYNQIEAQTFDRNSMLYSFDPEIIIIYKSSHKLLQQYNKLPLTNYENLADNEMAMIGRLVSQLSQTKAKLFFYNYTEIDDAIFGNHAAKTESSFLFQVRKLNYLLMNFAVQHPNLYLVDLTSIQNTFGKRALFSSSLYLNTELTLSIGVLPLVAARTCHLIAALEGRFKKCVIADLDNTLWGGIIGDDGLENIQVGALGIGKAFTEFQYWLKKLKNRGIILAVCSKNTESVAKEPFEKHPDMVLCLDDFAVFVANWESKVDNIRHIQKVLNIGFDSMVFLDDNPYERNVVASGIPQLTIPELPEDPGEYLEYLYSLNLFETVSISKDDSERTKQYQQEAKRAAGQQQFTSEDDFLKDLNMHSLIEPFNKFNIPRVAQLTQRSNQFNLRTIRYSEDEIQKVAGASDRYTMTFTLDDKFGKNGLVCVIILQKQSAADVFIDTWLMSCRVLKRGMENFVLNQMAEFCRDKGFKYLKGEYVPTLKNELVKNHFDQLGFKLDGKFWKLGLHDYEEKKCFIKKNKYEWNDPKY